MLYGGQDSSGALGQQGVGNPHPEGMGLAARGAALGMKDAPSVRVPHQSAQVQPPAVQGGVPSDGDLTAALEALVHGPLGQDPVCGLGVVQGGDEVVDAGVIDAAFDADGALADGGQGLPWLQQAADTVAEAQPLEAGGGEDDGVEVTGIEPGEAGIDIAPQGFDPQIRPSCQELALAAQAGGANPRPLRQLDEPGKALTDEGVPRVLPLQDHR